MPEPQQQKPWEKYSAVRAGPWGKYTAKKAEAAPKPSSTPTPSPATTGAAPTTAAAPPSAPEPTKAKTPAGEHVPFWKEVSERTLADIRESPFTPGKILQNPHWYGRSVLYAGGELKGIGEMTMGGVAGTGSALYHLSKALDPLGEPGGQAEGVKEFAEDVKGMGKGFVDLGKASWDLIRHFPESWSDPERVSTTITQDAMLVDGGLKLANRIANSQVAAGLGPAAGDFPTESLRAAHRASSGTPSVFFRRKAFEDVYVHTEGLRVAKEFTNASKEVQKEVSAHASNLARQIPDGVDAIAESQLILKEFRDVVKAPEAAHPVLRQMVKDAQNPKGGGIWSWEKAAQFRSSVGRSLDKVSGPQKVVLTRVYGDLTNKLASLAKKHDLGDSWTHYQTLEKKYIRQFGDLADSVSDAQSGKEVASILGKDKALTQEVVNNLSKYGLDAKRTLKFAGDSNRITKQQAGWKGTLFRMAYGTPAGVPVMVAARAAGAGWMEGVAAGALAGAASVYITNMIRALKLSPEVINEVLQEREIPGRMPIRRGAAAPTEAPSTLGGGAPTQGTAAPEPAPTQPPRYTGPERRVSQQPVPPGSERRTIPLAGLTGPPPEQLRLIQEYQRQVDEASTVEEKTAALNRLKKVKGTEAGIDIATKGGEALGQEIREARAKAPPEAVGREPGAKSGTTRESAIGRRTKARERVAKQREESTRTREQEIADAQARAQAQNINVTQLGIPEMEETLKSMEPEAFSALQKARRMKKFDEADYEPYLRELVIRAWEKRTGGGQ